MPRRSSVRGRGDLRKILDADERNEAESGHSEDHRRATACALEAQARGRAFVYTYRLLASPDVDLVYQAVFGAHGERLLLRMGLYAGENIRTVESCAALTVQPTARSGNRAATSGRASSSTILVQRVV